MSSKSIFAMSVKEASRRITLSMVRQWPSSGIGSGQLSPLQAIMLDCMILMNSFQALFHGVEAGGHDPRPFALLDLHDAEPAGAGLLQRFVGTQGRYLDTVCAGRCK